MTKHRFDPDNSMLDITSWWIDLALDTLSLKPPSVFWFFGGTQSLDSYIAGWYFVSANLQTNERKKAFSKVVTLVPNSLEYRATQDVIAQVAEEQMQLWKWDEETRRAFRNSIKRLM